MANLRPYPLTATNFIIPPAVQNPTAKIQSADNPRRQDRWTPKILKKQQTHSGRNVIKQEIADLKMKIAQITLNSASHRIRAIVAERELEEMKVVLSLLRKNNAIKNSFRNETPKRDEKSTKDMDNETRNLWRNVIMVTRQA